MHRPFRSRVVLAPIAALACAWSTPAAAQQGASERVAYIVDTQGNETIVSDLELVVLPDGSRVPWLRGRRGQALVRIPLQNVRKMVFVHGGQDQPPKVALETWEGEQLELDLTDPVAFEGRPTFGYSFRIPGEHVSTIVVGPRLASTPGATGPTAGAAGLPMERFEPVRTPGQLSEMDRVQQRLEDVERELTARIERARLELNSEVGAAAKAGGEEAEERMQRLEKELAALERRTRNLSEEVMGQQAAPSGQPGQVGPADSLPEPPVVQKPSGLFLQVRVPGEGPPLRKGEEAVVHYTAWLADGTRVDSSRSRGAPLRFEVGRGQVIQGWDEGVEGMRVGEIRRLVIPPALAYGQRKMGPIPANSTLVFEVELLGIGGRQGDQGGSEPLPIRRPAAEQGQQGGAPEGAPAPAGETRDTAPAPELAEPEIEVETENEAGE